MMGVLNLFLKNMKSYGSFLSCLLHEFIYLVLFIFIIILFIYCIFILKPVCVCVEFCANGGRCDEKSNLKPKECIQFII